MSHKYSKIFFVVLVAISTQTSCTKLDYEPLNRFTENTFWLHTDNVNSMLNLVYEGMYSSQPYFYNEALSDNAFTRLGISSGFPDAISSGNFTSTLERFRTDWGVYYAGIKACNIFLENIDNNTTLDEAVKNRMKGEVRFVRAMHYSRLINWWGDVPLLTKDISADEAKTVGRTSKAEVLNFILAELDEAAALLPVKEQYSDADRGRITKGAALALKARVLLYEGNRMEEVVAICEQFMNNPASTGSYSLYNNYAGLFKPGSEYNNEVILDLQYVPNLKTWGEHVDFVPISAGARSNNLAPTQELVDSYVMLNGKPITDATSGYDINNPYENRDPRLTATVVYHGYEWVNRDGTVQTIYIKPGSDPDQSKKNEYSRSGQGTTTGYFWRKYYDSTAVSGFNSGLNLILIRYADILLMYAEAKDALGQMNADVWNATIRPIRQRAGFTEASALEYPAGNTTEIIRNERRSEFALEGLRIDDIRRWRIAEEVLNGWVHGARFDDPSVDNGFIRVQLREFDPSKHYLWPIPASEIALNNNLGQNPNY
jgi:hypothetical protein